MLCRAGPESGSDTVSFGEIEFSEGGLGLVAGMLSGFLWIFGCRGTWLLFSLWKVLILWLCDCWYV